MSSDLVDAVKEWRDARSAVLDHQMEFERTKKGMEVTDATADTHIRLLRRLGDAEHRLMQLAKKI